MFMKAGLLGWLKTAPHDDPPSTGGPFPCVLAIPARDEAALIGRCLEALAAQDTDSPFAVVLFLNNCRDGTADIVRQMVGRLPYALLVHDCDLPAGRADAAWARRVALNAAAGLVTPGGLLLTTDADSFAAPNWISACQAEIAAGADVVCGFVAPDFADAPSLDFEALRHGAMEYEYSQLTVELACLVDPDLADPWPRHAVETGANLAIKAAVLRQLDGIPHICPGEDAAFVRMAHSRGWKVRHAFGPHVTTSSRLEGRAAGGWSSDLKARTSNVREHCHESLEPAARTLRRLRLRRAMREEFGAPSFRRRIARLSGDAAQAMSTFDEAWRKLEQTSVALRRLPLRRTALTDNLDQLRETVSRLREESAGAGGPAGLSDAQRQIS